MKKYILPGILILIAVVLVNGQSSDEFFNKAAKLYVENEIEASKKVLKEGLKSAPKDKKLLALQKKVNATGITQLAESKSDKEVENTSGNSSETKNIANTSDTKTEVNTTNIVTSEPTATQKTINLLKSYGKFSDGSLLDVSKGEKLVCVFSMTCSHCQEVYRDMCEISRYGKLPAKYLYNYGESGEQQYFFNQAGGCTDPHIRFGHEKYVDFMRVLEGVSFPRILLFKNGEIIKQWDVDSYSKESLLKQFGIEEKKDDGGLLDNEEKKDEDNGSDWMNTKKNPWD